MILGTYESILNSRLMDKSKQNTSKKFLILENFACFYVQIVKGPNVGHGLLFDFDGARKYGI